MEIVVRDLRRFPADVVKSALEKMGRQKFWPAWCEIEDECSRLMDFRRRLETAVTSMDSARAKASIHPRLSEGRSLTRSSVCIKVA